MSKERSSDSGFSGSDTTSPRNQGDRTSDARPEVGGTVFSEITNDTEESDKAGRPYRTPKDPQKRAHGSSREISREPRKSRMKWLGQWGVVIIVAVIGSILVRSFLLEVFYIPSGSMEPTLDIGNRILVDKLSRSPGRFNIVVFKRPPTDTTGPKNIKYLVKRVVGLPGNTIASRHCQVLIDGKVLPEPFLPKDTCTKNIAPQRVPRGTYFVMGDNRSDSYDSRYFGPIKASSIVGRVIMRIWPLNRFKLF